LAAKLPPMPPVFPPLLRFALHLLLALAVLLQASIAVAMHAPAAGSAPVEEAATAGQDRSTAASSPLLPCHAVAAASAVDGPSPPALAKCGDGGALGDACRWACAQSLSLPAALTLGPPPSLANADMPAPLLPALRWIARSPLRPPIG